MSPGGIPVAERNARTCGPRTLVTVADQVPATGVSLGCRSRRTRRRVEHTEAPHDGAHTTSRKPGRTPATKAAHSQGVKCSTVLADRTWVPSLSRDDVVPAGQAAALLSPAGQRGQSLDGPGGCTVEAEQPSDLLRLWEVQPLLEVADHAGRAADRLRRVGQRLPRALAVVVQLAIAGHGPAGGRRGGGGSLRVPGRGARRGLAGWRSTGYRSWCGGGRSPSPPRFDPVARRPVLSPVVMRLCAALASLPQRCGVSSRDTGRTRHP